MAGTRNLRPRIPNAQKPAPPETPTEVSTSRTIGYDTAQKSGYDTEHTAHEARSTTNEVAAAADGPNRDRDQHEENALRDKQG